MQKESMEPSFDIDPIALKYIREEALTPEESVLLHHWLNAAPGREEMLESIKNGDEETLAQLRRLQAIGENLSPQKVVARLEQEGYFQAPDSSVPATVIHPQFFSRRLRALLVAASVTMIVGTAAWWVMAHRPSPASPVTPAVVASDVRPGSNRAVLTLADGRQIALDSAGNGVLAAQQSATVSKLAAGQLAYKNAATASVLPPAYNVLSTPRAGQFSLTLADGTRVWLNNASTLRYPVAFTGQERSVELTGEAYFEVAKDAAHPFRVLVHKGSADPGPAGTIEVLGTDFNVMAYGDEPTECTTLLSGSVRFSREGHSTLLHVDEQSVLDDKGSLSVLRNVNVQEVTAWKNGYFHFDHSSLENTMRQLARWYDIDVRYEGQLPPQQFMGKIQRNLPLSVVLKGLENDQVHFKLQGRELTVMP
jgi:transmembrane sensor